MVDLLTKPEFLRRAMPLSVEAWQGMIAQGLAPRRAELIRGVILEKTSKSILHTRIVSRLLRLVAAHAGSSCWVRQEDPLTLSDSEPEPDLPVVAGSEQDYDRHPTTALLVVEVSITTLREDREMLTIYAEAGVTESWIVNAAARCIEVYREPLNGSYQTKEIVQQGAALLCAALPGVTVDVRELFAGLPPVDEAGSK